MRMDRVREADEKVRKSRGKTLFVQRACYRSRFCNKKETRTDRLDARSWFSSLDSELFAHTSTACRRFGQAHRHGHATTLAHDFDVYGLANLMFVQRAVQVVVVAYLFAVHPDDDVPQLDVSIFSLPQA